MVRRTWEDREYPILEVITEADIEGEPVHDIAALATSTRFPLRELRRVVRDLEEDGWVSGIDASTMAAYDLMEIRPTAKARRAVGQWPAGNGYDDLLRLLNERISSEPDDDTRTRLERLRDGVAGVSREVGTALLTAWMKAQIPGM